MKLEEIVQNEDLIRDLRELYYENSIIRSRKHYDNQMIKVDYLCNKYGLEEEELRHTYYFVNTQYKFEGLGDK